MFVPCLRKSILDFKQNNFVIFDFQNIMYYIHNFVRENNVNSK